MGASTTNSIRTSAQMRAAIRTGSLDGHQPKDSGLHPLCVSTTRTRATGTLPVRPEDSHRRRPERLGRPPRPHGRSCDMRPVRSCTTRTTFRRPPRLQAQAHLEPELERPPPATWTSADAAGLPILPGLLLYQEVLSGKVGHAIRFTAECTDESFVWPARHEAGSCGGDYPPMGARFRLSASFSASEICKAGTPYCAQLGVIITAMQHYGLMLADNAATGTSREVPSRSGDHLIDMMKQIPARDFVAVDESCLELSANSAQASTARCRGMTAARSEEGAGRHGTTGWQRPARGARPHSGGDKKRR